MAKQNKYAIEGNNKVGCGSPTDTGVVPLDPSQSALLYRSGNNQGFIPVVDSHNNPLYPCKPSVAKRLVKSGKATAFFKKGFFAISINKAVEKGNTGEIVVAIDPGSKRTGITVATEEAVVLNIQCNTPDWVKEKVEARKVYRISRRGRKTHYRKCRFNRGSLVRHKGVLKYIGGCSKLGLSLHSVESGKRLCQNAKKEDCKILTKQTWRAQFLQRLKPLVSLRVFS